MRSGCQAFWEVMDTLYFFSRWRRWAAEGANFTVPRYGVALLVVVFS